MFILGISATLFGWGTNFLNTMSSVYLGSAPTFVGAVIAGIWAFTDGLIGGALIAWLYNWFNGK